jgi:hypothetical protein
VLVIGAAASPAAAESPIRVPEGCGSEAEFRSELERLTGAPAQAAMPSVLQIEAVRGEPGGYELRLVIGDELRLLRDPECRLLWRSAIVIAAAAARSERAPAPPPPVGTEPPPAPPTSAPVAPSVAPSAPAPATAAPPAPSAATVPPVRTPAVRPRPVGRPAPPTRPRRPVRASAVARAPERPPTATTQLALPALGELRAGLGLGVGVSGGVLPGLGGVLDAGGRLEVLPWAVDVAVRYWPERSESRDGRTVDVSAVGARVSGLFRVADALNLFAGIELNRLVGEGAEGVSGRNVDAVWQVAPTAGFNLITWDIGALRLEIGAAARLSVARPRFVVTGFGNLYRVPPAGADAIIRGVWLFR